MVLESNLFIFLFVLGKEHNRAVAGNTDLVQKNWPSVSPFACSERKHKRKANWHARRNSPDWSKSINKNLLKLHQSKLWIIIITSNNQRLANAGEDFFCPFED